MIIYTGTYLYNIILYVVLILCTWLCLSLFLLCKCFLMSIIYLKITTNKRYVYLVIIFSTMHIHVVVIVWLLDLQLPVQSVPITTSVVSLNPVHGEVYSIQHYVIKFVRDLQQVGGFLRVLWFPPSIKLTATI